MQEKCDNGCMHYIQDYGTNINIFLLGLNLGNDYKSSMPGSCSFWAKKTSLRLIEVNSKYFTEV